MSCSLGAGTFVDNRRVAGVAHAVFVRQPVRPRQARVAIDTVRGRAGAGRAGRLHRRRPRGRALPSFADVNDQCPRAALAFDKVRFVGDPVALVVAETRAQAVDAAELVDVDYDALPAVIDMEAALADGAPLQFEGLGSNIAARRRAKDDTDPWRAPTHVVRVRMVNQRIATAPIEGHAILVEPGRRTATVTAWVVRPSTRTWPATCSPTASG